MHITSCNTIFIVILLSATYRSEAISGGMTVESPGHYPFSVTLRKPILCGGAIISLDPPWVLTAAHCIENVVINDDETQSVAYGDVKFAEQTYATMKRAVIHPMYISSQQLTNEVYDYDRTEIIPYDIGLIELKEPLTASRHVNRIPIYTSKVEKEENSQSNDTTTTWETIGMGYLGYGQPHAEALQSTTCTLSTSNYLKDNNYNNSVILATSNAGLCHGDSGNPLLYKNEKSEYYIQGVLNRIFNAYDPDPQNYSCPLHETNATSFVNSFVKPSAHLKWIMKVTQLSKSTLTDPPRAADERNNNNNNMYMSSTSNAAAAANVWSLFIILPLLSIICSIFG
ncbi:trypsin-like cysteine/serine peptidase domain-containing protein [Mycotypha africana]|uniref:trypsin-like cysteine/serine peptidase domain-containing protein n=1 Tax=Mycotypha africana TaxID=64632 RepID=UPI0022FFC4E2|nr:trypsin-like cysteine/serine peptidase domain-containing protein [Mycotypha africana]KAI8972026.1 trypsin-like cysteine/serine peptidase domain-containing protein [Mycotypha africana]